MTPEQKRKMIDEVVRKVTDEGRIIEAGWYAFKTMCIPEGATEQQLYDQKVTFYAGAQHLWGAIMHAVTDGDEPTPLDEARMEKIDNELEEFTQMVLAKAKKGH